MDRLKKLAAMGTQKDIDLQAVLTPRQFQNYQSEKKKWRARAAASAGAKPASETAHGTD